MRENNRCVAAPGVMREAGSTLAADTWPREAKVGGVGSFGGRGFVALAQRLGFGWRNKSTATQPGAAPDRPQSPRFPALRLGY